MGSGPRGRSCGDLIAFILAGHPNRSNGAGLWSKMISSGLVRISSASSKCLLESGFESATLVLLQHPAVPPSSGSLWTSSLDWTGNKSSLSFPGLVLSTCAVGIQFLLQFLVACPQELRVSLTFLPKIRGDHWLSLETFPGWSVQVSLTSFWGCY